MRAALFFCFFLATQIVIAQKGNSGRNRGDSLGVSKPPYMIGGYSIDPRNKTVGYFGMVGGVDKNGTVWDGTRYEQDKTINYKRTTLILFGDNTVFKERFPFKGNLSDINIISCQTGYVIFKARGQIYFYNLGRNEITSADVSAYTAVSDSIYRDKAGALYAIFNGTVEKMNGGAVLDIGSLKHLIRNYYTDKNGLYLLNKQYRPEQNKETFEATKLEESHGTGTVTYVSRNYFIYNSQTYSVSDQINKLILAPDNLIEIKWNNETFSLTDGQNSYEKSNYDYSERLRPALEWMKLAVGYFHQHQVNLKSVLPMDLMVYERGADSLYIPFSNANFEPDHAKQKRGAIVNTSDGYYLVYDPRQPPQKIKQLSVYNRRFKKDEMFDLSKFESPAASVTLYDKQLYLNGQQIDHPIDVAHIRSIGNTNYLTDGKVLIYTNVYSSSQAVVDGQRIVFFNGIIRGIDLSKLKIIGNDRLTDGTHLFQGNTVFPISTWGMKVKILAEK